MAQYRDPEWLANHVRDLLNYQYPHCIDKEHGGYQKVVDGKVKVIYVLKVSSSPQLLLRTEIISQN